MADDIEDVVVAQIVEKESLAIGSDVLPVVREHLVDREKVRTRIYIILAGVLDSLDQAEHLTDRIMALVAGKENA